MALGTVVPLLAAKTAIVPGQRLTRVMPSNWQLSLCMNSPSPYTTINLYSLIFPCIQIDLIFTLIEIEVVSPGVFSVLTVIDVLLVDTRVPNEDDTSAFGEIKQGKDCMDILGHGIGESIGLFECHGAGGNQVRLPDAM